jgi:multisubunit Na+/H+ antiporter MnhG subunit
MKKEVGYIVAVVGLVIMAISFGLFKLDLPFLNVLKPGYVTILGIILIVVGVFIAMMDKGSGKRKQKKAEVPIYDGEEIVGYRRS